jgi:hypothetical protein
MQQIATSKGWTEQTLKYPKNRKEIRIAISKVKVHWQNLNVDIEIEWAFDIEVFDVELE